MTTRWKLKGCPRCNGDININDEGENCLQCGYTKSYDEYESPKKQPHGKGYGRHCYKEMVKV